MSLLTPAQVKEDRKATKAFRKAHPPTFDGTKPEKLAEWFHEIDILLEVCHCPKRIHKDLAIMQLRGSALTWWIGQKHILAQNSWTFIREAIRMHVEDTQQRTLFMHRWTHWKRGEYETVHSYIERFKRDILEIVPHDIDSQELLWHFWRGLPYFLQHEIPIPQDIGDMNVIFDHVVKVTDALGITHGMDDDKENDWTTIQEEI